MYTSEGWKQTKFEWTMERQDYPRPRVATNKEIDGHALDVIQELEEMIMVLKNDSSMTLDKSQMPS